MKNLHDARKETLERCPNSCNELTKILDGLQVSVSQIYENHGLTQPLAGLTEVGKQKFSDAFARCFMNIRNQISQPIRDAWIRHIIEGINTEKEIPF